MLSIRFTLKRLSGIGDISVIRMFRQLGSLHRSARFYQIVQINLHPQAGALVEWMKRKYLPCFLVPDTKFHSVPWDAVSSRVFVRSTHWRLPLQACAATLGSPQVMKLSLTRGFP